MLIAFTGNKGSGKSTAADYLFNHYGFQKIGFADPLKAACKILFGFSEEQLEGHQKEIIDPYWGVTPRRVMQIIGTEIFQYDIPKHLPEMNIEREFWIKWFERWYYYHYQEGNNVVISDLRFQHEADAVKKYNGKIIQILRNTNEPSDNHPSEYELSLIDCDYELWNDYIQFLHEDLDVLMDELL